VCEEKNATLISVVMHSGSTRDKLIPSSSQRDKRVERITQNKHTGRDALIIINSRSLSALMAQGELIITSDLNATSRRDEHFIWLPPPERLTKASKVIFELRALL